MRKSRRRRRRRNIGRSHTPSLSHNHSPAVDPASITPGVVPEGYTTITEGSARILQRGNEVFYNPVQVSCGVLFFRRAPGAARARALPLFLLASAGAEHSMACVGEKGVCACLPKGAAKRKRRKKSAPPASRARGRCAPTSLSPFSPSLSLHSFHQGRQPGLVHRGPARLRRPPGGRSGGG